MKAAIVESAGNAPVYGDFAEPVAGEDAVRVEVAAAAISQLTRGRASGSHYSASGRFPFVAGVDGVGRLEDGSRVYFVLPEPPHGALAERTLVQASHCLPVPDGLDDVSAAALANPGMSSWAALVERARIKPGETVLINGATGTSGRLAIGIARHLGAGKVVATGRNPDVLRTLAGLGADETIPLTTDRVTLERTLRDVFAAGVDIVLDYLWGDSALALLIAGARASPDRRPIRFVQIGSVAGGDIALPAAVLRSSSIVLMGSGLGSVPTNRLLTAIAGVFGAAGPAGLSVDSVTVPLSEIDRAWAMTGSDRRVVVVPSR